MRWTPLSADLARRVALPLVMAPSVAACSESPSYICPGYQKDSNGDASADPGDADTPPSCSTPGPGLTDCRAQSESCCKSLMVQGGSFYRTYRNDSGCSPEEKATPSTLSSFRLDKYTVTVGRFRQFVEAWYDGWRPDAGAGRHGHLNGG